MNESLESRVLPLDWRTATVKPIYKSGDKFDPANYRPISLTSLVVKIMEAIIYEKTLDFLQKHKIIPSQQHGFVPGKSVSSNLLCCLSDWSLEVNRGNSVDVAYLDFSKAFDRVPKRRLLFKLQHYGISGLLHRWIESFLTDQFYHTAHLLFKITVSIYQVPVIISIY
ncbi:uncharacterized protein LOC135125708 [Zophobas morio]|uniref:uncharacterized protein LOC135125708 n=1 Tax=Zophobas morio TaxID=2755281 RepID=UPI003082F2A5